MEKKKGVFVSALLYHEDHMYAGMSDGNIRVYREVGEVVLHVAPNLAIPFDNGSNQVGKIKLGAPADEAGLCEGMVVTHVNREPTSDAAAVRSALGQAETGGNSTVQITVKTMNKVGEPDFELVHEHRKHTGSVTCLEVVPGMGPDGSDQIYSGGRDWQIHIWGWVEGKFRYLEMFPVHQNAVRCMAYLPQHEITGYGGYIYSGGDDCTIRCRDIGRKSAHARERVTDGFPIVTRGSVRALAAYDQHLFSATADGMLQVWQSSEGTPVTTLFPSARVRSVNNQPQAQLCLIVANNMLWSGGVDGVIRVWKAGGPPPPQYPHGDWLACELGEHRGAFVNNMSAVQGAADGHVSWHLSADSIKLLYTESDSAASEKDWDHSEGFTKREQELIQQIEDMRKEMIKNSEALQEATSLHAKLERMDRERRVQIVKALGVASGLELKKRYFNKLFAWMDIDKARKRRQIVAEAMIATSMHGFMRIYLARLERFAKISQDHRRKVKFAESLAVSSKKGMQIVYYRKLVQYANRVDTEKRKSALADTLNRNRTKGLLAIYHGKCIRWSFRQAQVRKKEAVAEGLLAKSRRTVLTQYYYKLLDFHTQEVETHKKEVLVDYMKDTRDNALRHVYLSKCLRWVQSRKEQQRKKKVAKILVANHEATLRRVYRKKCIDWLVQRKTERLDEAIQELDEKILKSEKLLEDSRSYTDEMMQAETDELTKEMDRLETEITSLEKEIASLASENNKLRKDLMASFVLDPSKTEAEHLQDLILHLKSHGVNCKYDYDTINTLKEGSNKFQTYKKTAKQPKPCPAEPARVFHGGLVKVREALSEQLKRSDSDVPPPKEGEEWELPGDLLDEMDHRLFHKGAHAGLKQVVIGFDQFTAMTPEEQKKFPLKHRSEAIRMQNWLVDIVARVYQERKGVQADEQISHDKAINDQVEELERQADERGEAPKRQASTRRSLSKKSMGKQSTTGKSGDMPTPVRSGSSSKTPGRKTSPPKTPGTAKAGSSATKPAVSKPAAKRSPSAGKAAKPATRK
eukprot:TRINITY_DN15788_c0_g3_i1.p1 TRINITY_DN15788_c0_g3~~TRINITY_DN15788_c0_g3_i1.p1  ORF type:complete len:1130 (+),score=578.48 TRINITY_DN15788_c0_g3_i1:300-3392(+)